MYFSINQLFAKLKKEVNCLRLEKIRTALAEADAGLLGLLLFLMQLVVFGGK